MFIFGAMLPLGLLPTSYAAAAAVVAAAVLLPLQGVLRSPLELKPPEGSENRDRQIPLKNLRFQTERREFEGGVGWSWWWVGGGRRGP